MKSQTSAVRVEPLETRDPIRASVSLDQPFHRCVPDPGCPHCAKSASANSRDSDWSFLDAVYCISLRSREDRASAVMRELHRVGLCRHCTFYRPVRGPGSVKRNIWNSHQIVARHARESGAQRVLILEDDVEFTQSIDADLVRSIDGAIRALPPDWLAFYLGHWPLWARRVDRRVLRTRSLCTHAYVASPRMIDWLCRASYLEFKASRKYSPWSITGGGIDAAFAKLPGMYAYYPMLAFQNGSPSDHRRAGTRIGDRSAYELKMQAREYLLANHARSWERLIVGLSSVAGIGAPILEWLRRTAPVEIDPIAARLVPEAQPEAAFEE